MTEPVELRTERLLLGPFRLEDVDDVLEYARDPEWAWSLPAVPQPYERRHAEEFVARTFLAPWDTRPEVVYMWVDGVYVKAGLEKEKAAVLVVMAALSDG